VGARWVGAVGARWVGAVGARWVGAVGARWVGAVEATVCLSDMMPKPTVMLGSPNKKKRKSIFLTEFDDLISFLHV
jgi:hypothetical protein